MKPQGNYLWIAVKWLSWYWYVTWQWQYDKCSTSRFHSYYYTHSFYIMLTEWLLIQKKYLHREYVISDVGKRKEKVIWSQNGCHPEGGTSLMEIIFFSMKLIWIILLMWAYIILNICWNTVQMPNSCSHFCCKILGAPLKRLKATTYRQSSVVLFMFFTDVFFLF